MMYAWIFSALLMTALWGVQWRRKNATIANAGWPFALGLIAIGYAIAYEGHPLRRYLLAVLGAGWAFRLAYHTLILRVFRQKEDGRYADLRARWKEGAQANFFLLFQVQALLVVIFSIPFFVVATEKDPLSWIWVVLAIGNWLIAVTGEAQSDLELARFKQKPENSGKVCRDGFWRYSRHPNYFFEWLQWWTYVFLSMGSTNVTISLIGPFAMFVLLSYVTGIPSNEARALKSRGGEYASYQRTNSAFFPWFPKE